MADIIVFGDTQAPHLGESVALPYVSKVLASGDTITGLTSKILAVNGSDVLVGITDNSANWNTAYGWGNHASAGYFTATTGGDGNSYLANDGTYRAINISPAGSNTQVQFNNSGAFGASAGMTYSNGMFLEAQAGTHVPLKIKAHSSQSVNPFQILNSSDTVVANIDWGGFFSGAGAIVTSYLKAPTVRFEDVRNYNNTFTSFSLNQSNADVQFHGAVNVSNSVTTTVAQKITLANSQSANAFEINSYGGSGGDLSVFTNDGWLGIGCLPRRKLEVGSVGSSVPTSLNAVFQGYAAASNSNKLVYFGQSGNYGEIQAFDYNTYTSMPLAMQVSGGSVVIGATSATAKLDVNGTMRVRAMATSRPTNAGELYQDTAANIAANGDLVVGIRQ